MAENLVYDMERKENVMLSSPDTSLPAQSGRPVRVVSLSFMVGLPHERVCACVDLEGRAHPDLIALPETWSGGEMEALDGRSVSALRELAGLHHSYIVCPIYRAVDGKRFNSSVLIDRAGEVAGIYDKAFPYWSEFDCRPPAEAGGQVPVFTTDFGRLGCAICFDANFPEVWQALAEQDAELVIFSSAYSAGTTLQAHALTHHYYVVSATYNNDCLVYDITGALLRDEHTDGDINITRVTLDLDRGIYHENFNEKRFQLLAEHGSDIVMDTVLPREQWFTLQAQRPGVSARGVARTYGLEELRDYQRRSRQAINHLRGGPLSARHENTHAAL